MLQNFTNVIKGQIILIMWNTVSHAYKEVDVWNSLETKFAIHNWQFNAIRHAIRHTSIIYISNICNTLVIYSTLV
jgi:hypothetical protein